MYTVSSDVASPFDLSISRPLIGRPEVKTAQHKFLKIEQGIALGTFFHVSLLLSPPQPDHHLLLVDHSTCVVGLAIWYGGGIRRAKGSMGYERGLAHQEGIWNLVRIWGGGGGGGGEHDKGIWNRMREYRTEGGSRHVGGVFPMMRFLKAG